MNRFLIISMLLCFVFLGFSNSFALDSYYDNKKIYRQELYNNKIPYMNFFSINITKPKKIKIQRGNKQSVVHVNLKEDIIEQKGLEK